MIYASLFSLSFSHSRTPWMKHVQKGWQTNTTGWKVGSPPALHHRFLPFLFCFCTKSRGNTLRSCTPGTRAVPFPCSRSSLPPPHHLLLLHTRPLSPNNVLMRSPLPFTPSSPPPPPSLICSSPPPPPAVLHSSMFPPSRCDVILD